METSIWNLGLLRVAETPSLHGGANEEHLAHLVKVEDDRYIETEDEFRLWLCYCLDWNWIADKDRLDRAVEAARALKGIDPEAEADENAQIVARLRWLVGEAKRTVDECAYVGTFRASHVVDTFAAIATNKERGGWQPGDPEPRLSSTTIMTIGYSPAAPTPTDPESEPAGGGS